MQQSGAGLQKNTTAPCSEGHIVNIGTLIEDMENTLRNQLDQVTHRGRRLLHFSFCLYDQKWSLNKYIHKLPHRDTRVG